ncbi:MAG: methionyl-tRNA formyltransferase [Candidatus Saccharimonadales bacterium]
MTPISKTILYFGNERLATGLGTAAPALRGLIAAGYNVAAVVVAQNPQSKSRNKRSLEVADIAAEHGIPVIAPQRLSESVAELKNYRADIGVLAAYGKIVPQAILDIFPFGIINIHPSLLPLHRGSTPIESVILEGAAETGVSLMRLAPQMDAGPVYVQDHLLLRGDETKQVLSDQLSQLGADLLIAHLPEILDGSMQPIAQDESRATTDPQMSKSDAILDFQKPAERLEREIRAYAGWPRSRCTIGGQGVIITAAHVEPGEGTPGTIHLAGKQIGLQTSAGVLIINSLIPAGRKEMTGEAYLAGYKP